MFLANKSRGNDKQSFISEWHGFFQYVLHLSQNCKFQMFYTHTHTHIITYTLDSFPTIFAAFEIDAQ